MRLERMKKGIEERKMDETVFKWKKRDMEIKM